MAWGGTRNTGTIMSGLRACPEEEPDESTKMPPLSSPSLLFTHDQPLLHISGHVLEVDSTASSPTDLHGGQEEGQILESWSQMLIGGLVGDHERYNTATALLSKGLEKGPMAQTYDVYGHGGDEIQASGAMSQLSQMLLASSPRSSCITASLGGNVLDFSNGVPSAAGTESELRNRLSDNSSENNNSPPTGSASKKARVQASSSGQPILKVRKERLGDRITTLHQIVSPFGKTDTASVLQETIGYIGFLMGQIEALSYPYIGRAGTGSSAHQQINAQDGEEGKKDLRSRGLCLVPVSCTSHLAAGSASDFWPAASLAGIILR